MAMYWYIIQTKPGFEGKVEQRIKLMQETGELAKEIVADVKVPSQSVAEIKGGKKKTVKKRLFPGYVMIEMDLPLSEWKATCSSIRAIDGVLSFVGSKPMQIPVHISTESAKEMLQRSGELKGEAPIKTRQDFSKGDQVRITGGPFATFSGTIEEVIEEKSRLKVMVGIFGRSTAVDVDMQQVEKA